MYSDELMEMLLAEEEVPEELIHEVVRSAVGAVGVHAGVPRLGLSQQGRAAAAGRGGPLLPSPLDCETKAFAWSRDGPHAEDAA